MENFREYLVIAFWVAIVLLIVAFFTLLFVWWACEVLLKIREDERINYKTSYK